MNGWPLTIDLKFARVSDPKSLSFNCSLSSILEVKLGKYPNILTREFRVQPRFSFNLSAASGD